MSQQSERRGTIEALYNGLEPKKHRMLAFPTEPFEGSGQFTDRHLAEIVSLGSMNKQEAIAFAIKLGRELERKGL